MRTVTKRRAAVFGKHGVKSWHATLMIWSRCWIWRTLNSRRISSIFEPALPILYDSAVTQLASWIWWYCISRLDPKCLWEQVSNYASVSKNFCRDCGSVVGNVCAIALRFTRKKCRLLRVSWLTFQINEIGGNSLLEWFVDCKEVVLNVQKKWRTGVRHFYLAWEKVLIA